MPEGVSMTDVHLLDLDNDIEQSPNPMSYVDELFNKVEKILHDHRQADPDLYRLIEEQKLIKAATKAAVLEKRLVVAVANACDSKPIQPLYFKQHEQNQLKKKITANQNLIHEQVLATQSMIVPRTKARNAKQSYVNVEEMKSDRETKLSSQIQAWRSVLPTLIKRFAKVPDPRRAKSIKHQLSVVLLYGLFAFIFQMSSRREINRELSGAVIFENLQKLFPELETIPHADTLARVLEKMNVYEIERAHMRLIYELIRKKKFRKLLISGCLPVALDGTQKLYRGTPRGVYQLGVKVPAGKQHLMHPVSSFELMEVTT
jgi:DDE_Tnp_1-associated